MVPNINLQFEFDRQPIEYLEFILKEEVEFVLMDDVKETRKRVLKVTTDLCLFINVFGYNTESMEASSVVLQLALYSFNSCLMSG